MSLQGKRKQVPLSSQRSGCMWLGSQDQLPLEILRIASHQQRYHFQVGSRFCNTCRGTSRTHGYIEEPEILEDNASVESSTCSCVPSSSGCKHALLLRVRQASAASFREETSSSRKRCALGRCQCFTSCESVYCGGQCLCFPGDSCQWLGPPHRHL